MKTRTRKPTRRVRGQQSNGLVQRGFFDQEKTQDEIELDDFVDNIIQNIRSTPVPTEAL